MAEFIAKCPHCGGEFTAAQEWIGQTANCPSCGNPFTIAPALPEPPDATPVGASVRTSMLQKPAVPLIVAALALLTGIAALLITLFSSDFPKMKFSTDPAQAVKNYLAFNIQLASHKSYFWKKNGGKILRSLEIKEIKTNGDWAVAFYKISLGATENKDTMFLYRSKEGYWVQASSYQAEKRCQSHWYKDIKDRIDNFTKDSGSFDDFEI